MIRRITLSLTLIVSAVILFIIWLLGTESGLQWGYQQAQSRIPTSLSISGISGRIIGPLTIEEIRYDDHGQVLGDGGALHDTSLLLG